MSTEYAVALGNAIRAARQAKGYSLEQLAERAGVDLGYLSRLENGKKQNPSTATLQKIADGLGLTLDQLLLPEPHDYFIRKLGVSAEDADALARLVVAFVREKSKEVKNAKDD